MNHTLSHLYYNTNPKYIIRFTIDNQIYQLDIKSTIFLELKSNKDWSNLNKFKVVVSKINADGFALYEDDVELIGNKAFEDYIAKWYEKAQG
jgi:hypothetical protein